MNVPKINPDSGVTDDRLRTKLKEYLGLAAAIAAACGIVLGVMEYYQRADQARSAYTMDQIDIWEQRGARHAYLDLSQDAAALIAQTSDEDLTTILADKELLRRAMRKIGSRLIERPENAAQVDEIVYFFTRLGLCIEANLCDAHVAKVFFNDTLNSFLNLFRSSLNDKQAERPGYGEPLKKLNQVFATTD